MLAIIRAVKANAVSDVHRQAYRAAAQDLATRGAACLVVACTELSVLEGRDRSLLSGAGAPVLDTLDVLVDDILARCGVTRRGSYSGQ